MTVAFNHYLLNDDKSDNDLARKIFIFSNPGLFLL